MAEPTSVALAAAPIPSSAEISRAEKLVRERFLHDGEDPAVALAPGSPRRRALDMALAELAANPKQKNPSTAWRREFSLLLGLERLLSDDEPKLVDGTVLSAHQVDALSGTLAALLAAAQATTGNGRAAASASPELLASAEIFGVDDVPAAGDTAGSDAPLDASAEIEDDEDDEEPEDDEDELDDDEDLGPVQRAAPDEDDDELDDEEEEDDEEELD
ncbi:MAG TPA: hypothetical protein VK774_03780, partial [Solirubrobacteraceae bacterium]|nr:hypothetical protein [Solirubrobacteraceae bacterium]